jgi:hypothetical protein
MPRTSATAAPVAENEHVQELLGILKSHKSPNLNALLALLGQVTAMEKQLEAAVGQLEAMRRDLAEAERRNHPVRHALQKAVIAMQAQVLELRDRLGKLKQAVIDGCKNAVAAFKEKGITALDNLARFFKVRPMLEAIHTGANKAAQAADRAVSNIEAASAAYHEAGRRVKNAGRALSGKEAVQEAKPNGRVSKTFTAPFRAVRACFAGIRNHGVVAVSKLKALEEKAKPSIEKTMQKYQRQIEEKERAAPKRDKARPTPSTEL